MNKIERKINRTVQLAKNVRLHRADGGETDPMLNQDTSIYNNPYKDQVLSAPEPMTVGQYLAQAMRKPHETNIRDFPQDFQNLAVVQGIKQLPEQIWESIKYPTMALKGELQRGIDPHTGQVTGVTESGMGPTEAGMVGAGLVSAGAMPDIAAGRVTPNVMRAGSPVETTVGAVKAPRSDLGFYSHGSETAANLPQAKGPADQLIGMLRNQGVRPEELAHAGLIDEAAIAAKQAEIQAAYAPRIQAAEQGLAGLVEGTPEYKTAKRLYDNTVSSMRAEMNNALVVHPDWAGKPVTREELSQHLHQSMPRVEERVLGKTKPGTPYPEEYKQLEESIKQKYNDAYKSAFARFQDQTLPQAERIAAENDIRNIQKQFLAEVNEQIPDRNLLLAQAQDKFYPTKYSDLTIPGGENYRELLLKLPPNEVTLNDISNKLFAKDFRDLTSIAQEKAVRNELERLGPRMGLDFTESHWEDPNVLAHLRMADRVGPNGEKLLHVEEIQSDWGQKGRDQGFKNPAKPYEVFNTQTGEVYGKFPTEREAYEFYKNHPDSLTPFVDWDKSKGHVTGPYVTSTQGWTDLALKRVMKEAAEGGYDGVVFTPGSEQAKRFDLSKQISKVTYDPHEMELYAYDKAGNEVINEYNVQPKDLHKYIGKEPAEKLRAEVDNAASVINEYDVGKDPDTGRWEISLYGEPLHDYGGQLLQFKSEDAAKSHLQEMIASETRYNLPTLSGLDLQVGGEGMTGYYDKIVPSRLKELMKGHDKEAKLGTSPIAGGRYEVVSQDGNVVVTEDSKRAAQNIAQGLGLERYTIRQQDAVHGLHMPMTDKMRQSILSGQRAFNEGGRVGFADGGSPPWGFDFNQPTIDFQPQQPSVPPLADLNLYKGAPLNKPPEPPQEEQKQEEDTVPAAPHRPEGSGSDGSASTTAPSQPDFALEMGPPASAAPSPFGGLATAAGFGPGMTVGNTVGGLVGGLVGTAVAGPFGGLIGGALGRHAANAISAQDEDEDADKSKSEDKTSNAIAGVEGGGLGPATDASPDAASQTGAPDSSAESATANMQDGGAITVRRYRAAGGPIKLSPSHAEAGPSKISPAQAKAGNYKKKHLDGKAHKRIMDATKLSVQEYKDWIKHGDLKKPVSSSPFIQKALMVASKKS